MCVGYLVDPDPRIKEISVFNRCLQSLSSVTPASFPRWLRRGEAADDVFMKMAGAISLADFLLEQLLTLQIGMKLDTDIWPHPHR